MDRTIVQGNAVIVNKKKIGTVIEGTFYKIISGSKHIMRNPHAIFFDVSSLREAESYGAKFLHITDKETGDIYTASFSDLWQYAIHKNFGFGEQVGLKVNRFNVTSGADDASQAQWYSSGDVSFAEYEKTHHTVAEKRSGQMDLFGGVQ